jgi:phage antirepressor YoqD-like protein
MPSSSIEYPPQRRTRLVQPNPESVNKRKRRFMLGITFIVALLFVYHLIANQGGFRVKQVSISGNNRYTQDEIMTASGLNFQQNNVHTVSVNKIEKQLTRKLSYVKKVDISKDMMKRAVTIEITERAPAVLLKYLIKGDALFALVDSEGYVLEYKYGNPPSAPDAIVTIIGDNQSPIELEIGAQMLSDSVQLGLKVHRAAVHLTPEVARKLHTIDANQSDKITLQFDNLPVVWLASDLIDTGIHNINIFFAKYLISLQKRKPASSYRHGYLDARFEDALYWGGKKHG